MRSSTTEHPHHRVAALLRFRIRSGEWAVGTMTPSRRALADEFGVALTTIERAVGSLIAEGLLRADDRRGTFVTAPPVSEAPTPVRTLVIISDHPEYTDPAVVNAAAVAGSARIRSVLRGLEETYSEAGGKTHFISRGTAEGAVWRPVREVMEEALKHEVDAIAFVGIHEQPGVEIAYEIVSALNLRPERRVPTIYISWGDTALGLYHVYFDNTSAGYLAAEHLIRNGWRSLVFFDLFTSLWAQRRLAGAQEAVRRMPGASLRVFTPSVRNPVMHSGQVEVGEAAARQALAEGLLESENGPIGWILPNDFTALGVRQVMLEVDKVPGRDFALIGFDDLDRSRSLGLSSMCPPLEALGAAAGRLLVGRFKGETTPKEVCLDWRLSARASTSPVTTR